MATYTKYMDLFEPVRLTQNSRTIQRNRNLSSTKTIVRLTHRYTTLATLQILDQSPELHQ